MGMIVKSLLAGVVLASMAGGGVYYGLSPVEGNPAAERPVKPINPKTVTVKKVAEAAAHPHPERKKAAKATEENSDAPKLKKSWMDQYINTTTSQDTDDTFEDPDAEDILKTDMDIEVSDSEQLPELDVEIFESEMRSDSRDTAQEARARAKKMRAEARKAREMRAETRKMRGMARAEKRKIQGEAKGNFIVEEGKPSSAIGTMESYDTVGIIMREAAQIESVDLRDRAYLSVVDYTLSHGYFGEAKAALEKIAQPELRETARSRIAVNYAGTGNPEAAFDLVEGVEITDFKDAMRIQIIEALIAAESQKHSEQ